MHGEKKTSKNKKSKRPRYHSIVEELHNRLADGRLAPGVKLPALRELADEFNVSTNTVRNAICVLEREGILYHVPAVGAFVNPNFSSQVSAKQITIAFAAVDVGSGFDLGIARGIETRCQKIGWEVQIMDAHLDEHLEDHKLSKLVESGVQGAIILPSCTKESIERLFKLKLAGFPFVLLDRAIPGLRVDLVESDNEKGGYQATEYLIRHGHKKILALADEATMSSIKARIRGYERALIDNEIEPRHEWKAYTDSQVLVRIVREQKRWLGGYETAITVLKKHEPPLAIFALNDFLGWGVYVACRELGLRIPDDVSIICFDDSEITQAMTPPMTAIAQRTTEIGQHAVKLLERRLLEKGDHEPQHILVGVDMVKRQSVASIPKR